MRYILLISALVFPAFSADLSGPIQGFVYDGRQQAIRPMLGVPGSAYLGAALQVGVVANGIEAASVAPDGSVAVAVRAGAAYMVQDLRNTVVPVSMDTALANADLFAWNRDSRSVAIYSSRTRRAQVIRNVLGLPQIGDTIDLSSLAPASSLLLAGDTLIAAVAGGVYQVAAGSAPKLLAQAASPVSLVSNPGTLGATRDAFFADRAQGRVLQIQNFDTAPAPVTVLDAAAGVSAIQFSADGTRLYAVFDGKRLETFDLASRTSIAKMDLDFVPSALEPLGEGPVFRMNAAGQSDQPLYVMAAADRPAVYFVPAGRGE